MSTRLFSAVYNYGVLRSTEALLVGLVTLAGCGSSGGVHPPDGGSLEAELRSESDAPVGPAAPRLIGRFDRASPAGPIFAFSGSAIEARFTGTGLTMRLDDKSSVDWTNEYTVVIDGEVEKILANKSSAKGHVLAKDLAAGEHHVLVWRSTESMFGDAQLLGLDLAPGGEFLPVAAPPRRLEFIGDSITCGYGILGHQPPSCTLSPETEDHYVTYGALAARALDADQVTICQSGIGIYQNNKDCLIKDTMPKFYTRTLPGSADESWDFASYVPQAVVINLGTNDWSLHPCSSEGKVDDGFETNFKNAYGEFIAYVRARYPEAWILLAVGPMLDGCEYTNTLGWLQSLAASDARVTVIEFPTQDNTGCDGHPTDEDHQTMAKILEARLRELLGW